MSTRKSSKRPLVRCGHIHRSGQPCKKYAMHDTDPARPRCAPHSGHAAPKGNENALKHGAYAATHHDLRTIDGIVADLAERQARLTAYLEQVLAEGGDIAEVAKVFALHGQNASRLGRLLRDQRALSGDSADGLLDAIGKALDEISTELGIRL